MCECDQVKNAAFDLSVLCDFPATLHEFVLRRHLQSINSSFSLFNFWSRQGDMGKKVANTLLDKPSAPSFWL